MKALFIGGTGVISSACASLAVTQGVELYLLTRGKTIRPVPDSVKLLSGDIRNIDQIKTLLKPHTFDVVVDWVGFEPMHVDIDIELFRDKILHYIFISSASVYMTPPAKLPVTEATPLDNPYWDYSQKKIACEERLMTAYEHHGFPVTIVRPSHTYDQTMLPVTGRYTVVDRMRKGKPVIVHGDGTSVWTLTHHQDFARGFVPLLGRSTAIGEAFHITSDEWLTWNQIFQMIANVAGTDACIKHVPSDIIHRYDPVWGAGLLGDKSISMIFDNSKIRQYVPDFRAEIPFAEGVKEIMQWFDADPSRQIIDRDLDARMDKIIEAYSW